VLFRSQEASYQEIKSFMEAYPYPDSPPGTTREEDEKTAREYDKLMGDHGINPKEFTHPSVSRRLLRDINVNVPPSGFNNLGEQTSMEKRQQSRKRQEQEVL